MEHFSMKTNKRTGTKFSLMNYSIPVKVFNKIFSFLDTPDISNCRLVCPHWSQVARKPLMKVAFVCFDSHEKVEEFLQTFRICPGMFYQNFIFEGPFGLNESINSFFTIFGPYIKSLIIRQCIWVGFMIPEIMEKTQFLENLTLVGRVSSADRVYPKATSCLGWDLQKSIYQDRFLDEIEESRRVNWAHLKNLTLDLGGYAEEVQFWNFRSDSGNIQPFIYQLLLSVPNLETISCPSLEATFPKVVLNLMLLRHEIKLSKLSYIVDLISKRVRNCELKSLEIKAFPLVTFNLDVHPDISLNILHNLLSSLGSTLKYLKLKFLERETVVSNYFPSSLYLFKLKHLVLQRFNGSLVFIHDLIALEELFLDDVCLSRVFSGPRSEPLELPLGFVFDSEYNMVSGGIRCFRDRSFIINKR